MDRSAKLSLWLETFDMALFILSFFKGALNSAAKKWADFLKKGYVPCWAWLRLKINLSATSSKNLKLIHF